MTIWLQKIIEKKKAGATLTQDEQLAYDSWYTEQKALELIREKRRKHYVLTTWEKAVLKKFQGMRLEHTKDLRKDNGKYFALFDVNTDDWTTSNPCVVVTLNRLFELAEKGSTLRFACAGAGIPYTTVNKWMVQGQQDDEAEKDTQHAWFYRTYKEYEARAMERHLNKINATDEASIALKWLQTRFKDDYKDEKTVNVNGDVQISAQQIDDLLKEYKADKEADKDV